MCDKVLNPLLIIEDWFQAGKPEVSVTLAETGAVKKTTSYFLSTKIMFRLLVILFVISCFILATKCTGRKIQLVTCWHLLMLS